MAENNLAAACSAAGVVALMICGVSFNSRMPSPCTMRSGQNATRRFLPLRARYEWSQSVVPGKTVERSTSSWPSTKCCSNASMQSCTTLRTGLRNSSIGVPMVMMSGPVGEISAGEEVKTSRSRLSARSSSSSPPCSMNGSRPDRKVASASRLRSCTLTR